MRIAVVVTGRYALPVLFVSFDYLLGDHVTDRPIAAAPWLLAKPFWILRQTDLRQGLDALVHHLSGASIPNV